MDNIVILCQSCGEEILNAVTCQVCESEQVESDVIYFTLELDIPVSVDIFIKTDKLF